jgi:hypothetical protein
MLTAVARRARPRRRRSPAPLDVAALDRAVDAILVEHRDGIAAGIWVGGPSGGAWYKRAATTVFPTASAIKTAYLVELFAAHAGRLDTPLPGLERLLSADNHPALAPFSRNRRRDIRRVLGGSTVRRIGAIMMAKTQTENHVYNAAANIATALLGGPAGLTRKIHARDAAFASLTVRRYMLADRRRDNTGSAASLAAVLQRLASRRVPGVDAATVEAMRRAMWARRDAGGSQYYRKSGYLPSDPAVSVLSGWWESGRRVAVSVVMIYAKGRRSRRRRRSIDPLAVTARRIRNLLLKRMRKVWRSGG